MRPPLVASAARARPAIHGSAPATALRTPTTLRRSTASNSAALASSKRRGCDMPALHTSTSMRPPCAPAAAASARSAAAASVTSAACVETAAAPLEERRDADASASTSGRRAIRATRAPRRSASEAIARPMPEEPPVIATTAPRRGKRAADVHQETPAARRRGRHTANGIQSQGGSASEREEDIPRSFAALRSRSARQGDT